ncbi:MAG: hypothetical protein R3D00_27320 [Bacteroidia bacterium]
MKRLFLIVTLFFNALCNSFAQYVAAPDSVIHKALECFQPNRKLPVFYYDKGENTKTVTDTFWIWNTTQNDIPVYLNPYYHEDWSMPGAVKANSKAPLVYYKAFENFEGYYLPINQGARIEYGKENLTVTLYTQLVNKNATMHKMPDGSLQFTIPLDSVKHNYLYTFPNGIMKEAGCKLNADSSKIGGITIKSKFGDWYDVAYHGMNFSFELMNAAIKDCKVYYTNSRDAKDYPIYVTSNKFNYLFPENANQIKIIKDSSSITYPLVNGENNRTIELYILQPNEPFMIINNIKRPVDYQHHQYAVFYNALPGQENNITNIRDYQKDYPDLKIYNIHHKTVFDIENLSETSRINILQALQNDSLVSCIVKLITKTDGKNNFQIFENRIYCFFPTTVQQENLIEKAKRFNFDYTSTEFITEYKHYFKYGSKLWDEKAMQQFNMLYQSYPYYNFKTNYYLIAEPESK